MNGYLNLLFAEETVAAAAPAVNTQYNIVMAVLKLVIAGYLVYLAITGKGKLIENQFPKCDPKKYMKIMRLICLFSALMILINAGIDFLGYFDKMPYSAATMNTLSTVFWALGLAGLIALIVVNVALTDRKKMEEAKRKALAEQYGEKYVNDPLHDAFVFDDEEEQKDEAEKPDEKN